MIELSDSDFGDSGADNGFDDSDRAAILLHRLLAPNHAAAVQTGRGRDLLALARDAALRRVLNTVFTPRLSKSEGVRSILLTRTGSRNARPPAAHDYSVVAPNQAVTVHTGASSR
jgi:hypothetical protein